PDGSPEGDGLAQLPPPPLLLDRGPRRRRLEGEQGAPAGTADGQRADQGAGERLRREAVRAPGPLARAHRRGAGGLPVRRRDLQPWPRAAGHAQGPPGRAAAATGGGGVGLAREARGAPAARPGTRGRGARAAGGAGGATRAARRRARRSQPGPGPLRRPGAVTGARLQPPAWRVRRGALRPPRPGAEARTGIPAVDGWSAAADRGRRGGPAALARPLVR